MHNLSQSLNKNSDNSPAKRSSSQKIDLLFIEFENLKTRIHKSTNKRKDASQINASLITNQSHQKNNSLHFKQQKTRDINSQQLLEQSQAAFNESSNFFKINEDDPSKSNIERIELKYLIRKHTQHFINNNFSKFERQVSLKIENLSRKLKISEETIKKIKTILSIKKLKKGKSAKSQPISIKLNNSEAISDIVLQYEQKINQLIQDYERRVEVAQQKGKDKETYSSTIRSYQKSSFQKELMLKQTEINKLKLSYHKLKRNFEQTKDKYENCLTRFQQLDWKASMKQDKNIQTENSNQKDMAKFKQEIQELKEYNSLKNIEIQRLNHSIKELKDKYEGLAKASQVINPVKDVVRYEIQNIPAINESKKPKDEQFYTQLEELEADISIFDQQFTKSQIIQPRRKKEMLQSLKSLELEVNLISEENKHLQQKKFLFETQLKNTQEDEERFVQQSNLLKSQIKRLNNSLQLLDKIMCQFIKEGKFDNAKVQELPQDLKSKALIFDFGKQHQKKK